MHLDSPWLRNGAFCFRGPALQFESGGKGNSFVALDQPYLADYYSLPLPH
jgi:hypothetical protein